jgi:hypothetical protein
MAAESFDKPAVRQSLAHPAVIHTMKANTNITIGNFAVSISADYDTQTLANLGLKWIAQRQTSIDKVLGGFRKVDGKDKRILGWKRNDVDYSPDMAKRLESALSSLSLPDSEDALPADVIACEYVREVAEPKYAGAKKAMLRHESELNDLESWLATKIGYAGPTHDADGEYHVDALRAVKAFVDRMNAAI